MEKKEGGAAIKTLADYGYRRIRADILRGSIRAGAKLPLEKLSREYDIGMSPLREALTRLVGDALVVSEGQRGFWVAPLSLAEFHDITRIRNLLEAEALQISVQRGGREWEEEVSHAFAELSATEAQMQNAGEDLLSQWESRNRRFHEALISACDSPWLKRLLAQLYHQSERYRWISLVNSPADRSVKDEHHAIFEAAMQRQVLKTCRLMEFHLNRTAQAVTDALRKVPGAEACGPGDQAGPQGQGRRARVSASRPICHPKATVA
ncbi:MAG: FCD domain-containing protein [Rhizobiales bacterium]|nr:FCD domain-containing protein [Hyphomicrobiales bacterium]